MTRVLAWCAVALLPVVVMGGLLAARRNPAQPNLILPTQMSVSPAYRAQTANPILPKTGNIRTTYLYHREAMGLSIAKDITVEVDRRADLMNSWQVLVQGSLGAVRILDAGVVTIDFDESV